MSRIRRTVRLRLPELSPREAAAVCCFLDQLDLALWELHGQQMVRLCEREGIPRILNDSESEQKTVRERRR